MKIVNMFTMMESGGAQHRAITIARELRKRDHECGTWFVYPKSKTFINEPFIKILYAKYPTWALYPYLFIKLIIELKKHKPDVFLSFGWTTNIFCILASFFAGIRIRIGMQISPSYAHSKEVAFLDKIFGTIGIYTANIMVSGNTLDTFALYPKSYLKRCRVIRSGIDIPMTNINTKKNIDKIIIGSIGRLTKIKNHEIVINSLSFLDYRYIYKIVGTGELQSYLTDIVVKNNLQDRVEFIGELKQEFTWDFLSSLDVFAFPSLHEAFSLTLVQAALCKIPIITIDVPIVYNTLGVNSCYISKNNPVSYAEVILNCTENKKLRTAIVNTANVEAQKYSLKNMIDGYESLLKELA